MRGDIIFANEKLINLSHPDILNAENNRGHRSTPLISIQSDKRVVFSVAAAEQCNMRIGRYVHFINTGKAWYFIVNDEPTGFKLIPKGNGDAAVKFHNTAFVKMFREATDQVNVSYATFYVQATKSELKGCKVFEILVAKSVQQLKQDRT